MAKWSIPEVVPWRAPQGVHLLLCVGLPALFWALAGFWILGSTPQWPQAALGLSYALLLAVWAPWCQRTRQGPLRKLWAWLFATIFLYVALAVFEGLPWPQTFGIAGEHLWWFLPAFLQGQLTAFWSGQLASRARLYQLIAGVADGKALEARVHDFQLDADFSRGNLVALTGSLVVLATLGLILANFSPYGKGPLSWILGLGFAVLCLLVGVLLRTYRREMEALVYGRRFTLAEKLAPLGWSVLLLLVAGVATWGLMQLGGPWLDWNSVFRGSKPIEIPDLPLASAQEIPDYSQQNSDPRAAVLMALLQAFLRVRNIFLVIQAATDLAVWLLPWAIAAFLLWPLVQWVLAGGRETRGLPGRWWRLIKDQWLAFLALLSQWWNGNQGASTSGLPLGAGGARQWLQSFFVRRSNALRQPYPPIIEAFLSLVQWAEPRIQYGRGETTGEFLHRLAPLFPEQASAIFRTSDLLERELFGPQALDTAQRKEFLDLVKALTSLPASHESGPGVS